MNAIVSGEIIRLASEVDPHATLHRATIAYLQALVAPYAEAVETGSIEALRMWIPQAFKGDMITHALEDLNKKLEPYQEMEATGYTPEVTSVARTTVIESLLAEIIDAAANKALEIYSVVIWPWDVQSAIDGDEALKPMFGFPDGLNQELPVEVTVGAQKFLFDLTMEFVAGLLLFSGVGNIDFNVTLFGAPFEAHDVIDYPGRDVKSRFEYQEGTETTYTVRVNGVDYAFNTPNFMQGFATGAQWAGVDHHAYWSELVKGTKNGDEITTTKITF